MKTKKTKLPIYNDTLNTGLQPGLYLGLYNGRRSKKEEVEDWGTDGPLIGPIETCHEVGGCELTLTLAKTADIKAHAKIAKIYNGFEMALPIDGGEYIKIGRIYYGDWSFFTVKADDTALKEVFNHFRDVENESFYEQLCNDLIRPLDQSAAGLKQWVKLRDRWEDAKADNADAPLLDELAALGTGHIYCDLIRLRKRISTE